MSDLETHVAIEWLAQALFVQGRSQPPPLTPPSPRTYGARGLAPLWARNIVGMKDGHTSPRRFAGRGDRVSQATLREPGATRSVRGESWLRLCSHTTTVRKPYVNG